MLTDLASFIFKVTLRRRGRLFVLKMITIKTQWNSRLLMGVVLAVGAALTLFSTQAENTLKSAFEMKFLVGSALNRWQFSDPSNAQTQLALKHFNSISPENALKWESLHRREGVEGFNFEAADQFVDLGVKNNMYIVGHVLVWHSQTPDWVFAGDVPNPNAVEESSDNTRRRSFGPREYQGPRATREELLERMREHIHTVVGRYKGKIHSWDVVNEALADGGPENYLRESLWKQIIGPDFIAKAFEYAHEADPDAILRYNDYGLENPVKRKKLIRLIKELQAQNVPIHAIGTQAHVNVSTTFEDMDQALEEMKELGLPIHVTELDVNTAVRGQRTTGANIGENASATEGGLVDAANQRQAKAYADIFKAFLKHSDSVELVTFWGVNDAVSWRRNGTPLLFDGENQPKPAFDAVMDLKP